MFVNYVFVKCMNSFANKTWQQDMHATDRDRHNCNKNFLENNLGQKHDCLQILFCRAGGPGVRICHASPPGVTVLSRQPDYFPRLFGFCKICFVAPVDLA